MKKILYLLLFVGLCQTLKSQTIPEEQRNLIYDRYGNLYTPSDLYKKGTSGASKKAATYVVMAGFFELSFEDTLIGFADPTPYNSITLGEARRNVVIQVYKDISQLITPTKNPSTLLNPVVRIDVKPSNKGLKQGALAGASAYTTDFGGVLDGNVWKTINTGKDAYEAYNDYLPNYNIYETYGYLYYHGFVITNFIGIDYNLDLTVNTPSNKTDLYSVLVHEAIHALGFSSAYDQNGNSTLGGSLTRYDTFLHSNTTGNFIDFTQGTCVQNYVPPGKPTSTDVTAGCAIIKLGKNNLPVYAPDTFSTGTSLSHLDKACTNPVKQFVMAPSLSNGQTVRIPTQDEVNFLCELGYKTTSTFGANSSLPLSYKNNFTSCGSVIAGNDDVIDPSTNKHYTLTAGQSIKITHALDNDINAVKLECPYIPYGDDAYITNILPTEFTVNLVSSSTEFTRVRYTPVDANGVRGNPTLVYIETGPAATYCTGLGCTPNPNLVQNPSFEEATNCPNNLGQLGRATGWFGEGTTPDYINGCHTGNYVGVPYNFFGYQKAKTGKAYINLGVGAEFAETMLCDSLQPNKTYNVEFYVNRTTYSDSRISDTLGLCLSKDLVTSRKNNFQYAIFKTHVSDTMNWVQVTGTYVAKGGEKYLTLGARGVPSSGGSYYFDDVSVTCTNCTPYVFTTSITPDKGVVSAGKVTICQGDTVTLTAGTGLSYKWSDNTTSKNIKVSVAGTYSVTVTSGSGCTGSANISVILNTGTPVTISGNTNICQGVSTTLTATTGTAYKWFSGETTKSITISPSTTTTYSVTVTATNGCTASNSVNITPKPIPDASITLGLGYAVICTNNLNSVSLHAAQNIGATYQWSEGSTTANISVSDPGIYSVTVTGGNSCTAKSNYTVMSNNPQVSITPTTPLPFCDGQAIQLNASATSSQSVSYVWSNSSTNASINVVKAGIYSVSITNNYGCTASASFTATTYPLLIADAGGDQSICYNTAFSIGGIPTAKGGTPPYTYQWDHTDMLSYLPPNSPQNPSAVVQSPSIVFTVTVTDSKGCFKTSSATITTTVYTYDYDNIYTLLAQNTTWTGSGTMRIRGPIVVPNGVTLTISNYKTVEFTNNPDLPKDLGYPPSGIVVQQGGTLILNDHVILKGSDRCNTMWHGIEVWGNANSGNGLADITNNVEIRDAYIGVALYRKGEVQTTGQPIDYGRGVLKTHRTNKFDLNAISIAFRGKTLQHNASRIDSAVIRNLGPNTTDLLKDQRAYQDYANTTPTAVLLNNVYGLVFSNCYFQGLHTSIRSYDSGFDIISTKKLTFPPPPNMGFGTSYKAIDAYSSGASVARIRIRDQFTAVPKQIITLNKTAYTDVVNCYFNIDEGLDSTDAGRAYNIYSYDATGYSFINNTFAGARHAKRYNYGVITRNANAGNSQQYGNLYAGKVNIGSQMEQTNSKLQIGCNTYNAENTYDLSITSGSLQDQGTCGGFNTGAINNFTACSSSIPDNQIHLNPGVAGFTYNTYMVKAPTCVTTGSTNKVIINNCNVATYNQATSCLDKTPIYTPPPPPPLSACLTCTVDVALGLVPKIDILRIRGQIASTTDAITKQVLENKLITTLLDNGQLNAALEQLGVSANTEDVRLTVPSYLQMGNCQKATEMLAKIPNVTSDDQAYHQLFGLLVNACNSGRAKANLTSDEIDVIASIANSNAAVSVNAQSILASISNSSYNRIPEEITFATSISRLAKNNNEIDSQSYINSYPNPFNTSTTIKFQLPDEAKEMALVIYDVTGKKIKEFKQTNGEKSGEFIFDAGDNNQGIYFCQLWVDGKMLSVKKLILIK